MGYPSQLPSGNLGWPYHQVTERDAWIDDPTIPEFYNHLYTLKPGQTPPAWFERQRKRLGDFAYEWKILIEHNYQNPVPGEGSAIFFHIRRGETKPSFGCTVMEKSAIEKLLCWLDPKASSVQYVLLTEKDYLRLRSSWNLPQ
jgi:L,D-peptidoglycan transpeptidase YkuD (ErfK/YbiS/YcfS/YnhG family)